MYTKQPTWQSSCVPPHVYKPTSFLQHRHRLEGTGATVRAGWERAHAYTCDVTDRHQVAETAQRVLKDFGRVDILVNNAPNTAAPKVHAPEVVVDVVNGNLLSHFWVSCKFVESYLLGVRKFGMSLRR
jgi:NAD(P)-dependent dehydrogenase (short-subunit alcohol dehydrogenase family)